MFIKRVCLLVFTVCFESIPGNMRVAVYWGLGSIFIFSFFFLAFFFGM